MILLASCASTKSDKVIVVPPSPIIQSPDSALIADCQLPVDLGREALTQNQIEKLWSTDRANLVRCASRHKALADFIENRDNLLREAVK